MKARLSTLALVLASLTSASVYAQTGYTITGGFGNFDVTNRCDHDCDEFEIEVENCRPEDVTHTYHNGNYGAPTITLAPNGTSTIIDYRNPNHLTPVNSIEHYGVCLRQLTAAQVIHVRWMRNGQTATVNGQLPVFPGSSNTAPATQPVMPSIAADTTYTGNGGDGIACIVTNNDPGQSIWIQRSGQVTTMNVSLEALMRNDPIVTTSVQMDTSPILLGPGQSVTVVNDLIELEDFQTVVFSAKYYQDLFVSNGIFGGSSHTRGPELGNVMTSTSAGVDGLCDIYKPSIIEQPLSQNVAANLGVNLRISAEGNDLDLTYQWYHDTVALTDGGNFFGTDTDELSIDALDVASQGFYYCIVSNSCGSIQTDSAVVFIEGNNNAPVRSCVADLGSQGGQEEHDFMLDNNDFVVFIDLFFNDDGKADIGIQGGLYGHDGQLDNNDFVVFIDKFFEGCE